MTKTKKILSMTLALLLAINALVIGASAVIGDGNELSVDVNLEVGWQNGDVFTPLAPGEDLQAGDVITVRICPTNDFWVGVTRYIVMYSKTKFKIVGEQKDAFTPNFFNPFYASVASAWTGATGASGAGVPTAGWPAAMRSTTAGGDGTFDNYTAVAVNNQAGPASASGGYPGIMSTGEWLFRFSLNVQQDITDASQARIWMDEQWLSTPAYPTGAMYFAKCTGADQLAAFGKANTYYYDMDLTGADVTLPLEGGVETSTITFDSAGGTAVDPITGNVGDGVVAPADPTKEGYTFAGWNPVLPDTYPAGGFSTTATWTANTYNAVFKVDGAVYETVPTAFGATITLPANPTKPGYFFNGWIDVPATMPANDVEINADFWINSYNAAFYVDGAVYETVLAAFGAQIVAPADPVKEGYTFEGWTPPVGTMPEGGANFDAVFTVNTYNANFYVDDALYETVPTEFGAQIVAPADPVKAGYVFNGWDPAVGTMGAADQDFNATWVPATDVTYTVRTYLQNTELSGYDLTGSQQFTGTTGETVTYTPPAIDGFTFNPDDSWVSGVVAADGSLYLNACYTRNSYTIHFNADGIETTITQPYGSVVAGPADPVKTGYFFTGWFDGQNQVTFPTQMPASDLFLVAQFLPQPQIAEFYVDSVLYQAVPTLFGQPIQAPADPVKTGYTFTGWDPAVGIMDTEGKVFNAQFTVNTYMATFYVDDVFYAVVPTEFGASVLAPPDPVKEGATFTGWNPVPGTMPAEDVRFDAVFSTEAYNAYFYVDDVLYATVPTAFGAQIAAPADPAKEGYTFAGWDPVPGTMGAADETFNATFTKNSYIAYFMVDGIVYDTVTVAFGDSIPLPADPSKDGSTFTGWDSVPAAMPADNVIINALFDVNAYNAMFMVDGVEYVSVLTEYGDTIDLPADPVKEGYTFTGWDFVPASMPAMDIVITAQFSINTYNANFDVDGVITTVPTEFGAAIVAPADPAKEGYTFMGWNPVPGTMGAADETFTATFAINTYNANFDVDGVITTVPTEFGAAIVAPADPVKEGYTFTGWDPAPGTMGAADETFTATFSVNTYNAIFMVDGAVYATVPTAFGEAIAAPADPVKDGCIFTGWDPVPGNIGAADETFTAQFIDDPTDYSVIYARFNDPYYGQLAPIEVKVTGRPSKIQFYRLDNGATLTYDRRLSTQIVSIQGYDAEGNPVDTLSPLLDYEIWTINVKLAETNYVVRAKYGIAFETVQESKPLTVTFETAPSLFSFTIDNAVVVRGVPAVFTVVTPIDVNKIQFVAANGATLTYATSYYTNFVDDANAGTRTWTISQKFGVLGDYTFTLRTCTGGVWSLTPLTVNFSVVRP